jgi:hypothetical protein
VFQRDDPMAQIVLVLGGILGALTEQGHPSLAVGVSHVEATA